jgi:hypothetical protein
MRDSTDIGHHTSASSDRLRAVKTDLGESATRLTLDENNLYPASREQLQQRHRRNESTANPFTEFA